MLLLTSVETGTAELALDNRAKTTEKSGVEGVVNQSPSSLIKSQAEVDNISPSESSLIEAVAGLLVDDNDGTRPRVETSTDGLVSTQGNLTEHGFKIQEALQNQDIEIDASKRLRGYFCSDIVFNLSHRV